MFAVLSLWSHTVQPISQSLEISGLRLVLYPLTFLYFEYQYNFLMNGVSLKRILFTSYSVFNYLRLVHVFQIGKNKGRKRVTAELDAIQVSEL